MNIKTTTIALVASLGLTGPLYAENFFGCGNYLDAGQKLEIGLIATEGDGVLEIYDYRLGKQGEMLGSTELHMGANPDVTVQLSLPARSDVLAVLMVGGEFVTAKHFHVHSE